MFRAANNVVYDMGSPLDKKRMIEDSLIYAVNYLKLNALLPIDPTALLGTGLYPNHVVEHPSDKRIIFTEKFLADINGSLSDIHLLRHYEGTGQDPLQEAYWYLENKHPSFQQITKKPIIWEEEGAFTYPWGQKNGLTNNEYAALLLNRVQARSCNIKDSSGRTVKKVSGWLLWSLGMPKEAEQLIGTMIIENEDIIYRYRSPKYRPNPCVEDPIPDIPKLVIPNMKFLPLVLR